MIAYIHYFLKDDIYLAVILRLILSFYYLFVLADYSVASPTELIVLQSYPNAFLHENIVLPVYRLFVISRLRIKM